MQAKLKTAKDEKEKELTKLAVQWDKKEKARVVDNKAKIEALNKKVWFLSTSGDLLIFIYCIGWTLCPTFRFSPHR